MKPTALSLSPLLLCFSLFILATQHPVMAQAEQASQSVKQSDRPESVDCPASQVFTFSSGANYFKFCISEHGNFINLISPSPQYHNFGREGYIACATGAANAYDGGFDEAGWGAATATQPGGPKTFPLTIKRTSTDGKLELTQTFNWDTAQKEVLIQMVLKNVSAGSLTLVKLARYFDYDLDSSSARDDNDDDIYDQDSDSVWGRDSGTGAGHHGVMLTALTFVQGHTTAVQSFTDFVTDQGSCTASPVATVPTAPGDYGGRVTYSLGTLAAGASKTVAVLYRRF